MNNINMYSYKMSLNHIQNSIEEINNGILTKEDFILDLNEEMLNTLLKPSFKRPIDLNEERVIYGKKLSNGVACGKICFSIDSMKRNEGENSILVTSQLNTEFLSNLNKIGGIISHKDEYSSHFSIACRMYGVPMITEIDYEILEINGEFCIDVSGQRIFEGDWVSIDASQGVFVRGKKEIVKPEHNIYTEKMVDWIDALSKVKISIGADSAIEAKLGENLNVSEFESRTEHMLFQNDSLCLFRKAILVDNMAMKKSIYEELCATQKDEIFKIYKIAKDKPVRIRLFDPPMHEFMSLCETEISELNEELALSYDTIKGKINELSETNPMLGRRGARLLIVAPEITEMQVTAIFLAAIEAEKENGIKIIPRITIPMVIDVEEIRMIKKIINRVASQINNRSDCCIEYELGAMIETPRSTFLSDELATEVDYFSFGTNDLTAQMLALSRGDCYKKFFNEYIKNRIFEYDPFFKLDCAVAKMIEICMDNIKDVKKNFHTSFCGEQGNQKETIDLCTRVGINSIAVSSTDIFTAKLFAAQASIKLRRTMQYAV